MTAKKHTPSGAQRSMSGRTQTRPDKTSPPKGKGKDAASDKLTAERIHSILSDPKTPDSVAGELREMVNRLGEWVSADVPETPDFFAEVFRNSVESVHAGRTIPTDKADEARAILAGLTLYAEEHEPQEYKVARRCAEIYDAAAAPGADYFREQVDAVLEGGEDGLIPNPDSRYFLPLFVESMRERGPRDKRVRRLLDLIRRVDEGADLNALHAEDERQFAERTAADLPKDTRLIDALSKVIADESREADRIDIIDTINSLSNHTVGVSDFHPEIFPTLARVIIREARAQARGRSENARQLRGWLRELVAVAGE